MAVSPGEFTPSPHVLRVLRALDHGFTPVTQLADDLDLSEPAVTFALLDLQRSGHAIVIPTAVGRCAALRS